MPRRTRQQLQDLQEAAGRRTPRRMRSEEYRAQAHRLCVAVTKRLRQSRSARPICWQRLAPGTVVEARVRFAESPRYKVRPAVVVSAGRDSVRVVPLSTIKSARPLVRLIEQPSFLNRPTGLAPVVTTVGIGDVLDVLGVLQGVNLAVWTTMMQTLDALEWRRLRHGNRVADAKAAEAKLDTDARHSVE